MGHGYVEHVAWYLHGDRPDLLLLHGFTDNAQCWDPLVPAFARYGGVLSTDARGHGRSGLPDGPVGVWPQTEEQVAVLRALATGPVIVVGHSMGAVTAMGLAARYPELVRAVILEDPPLVPAGAAPIGVPPWLADLLTLTPADRIARGRAVEHDWPDDELPPWATSKAQLDLAYCDRPTTPVDRLTELWARITCPVLLILGAPPRGGLVSAAEQERATATAAGPLTVVRFTDAGHSVHRDARARYLDTVATFLATLGIGAPAPGGPGVGGSAPGGPGSGVAAGPVI